MVKRILLLIAFILTFGIMKAGIVILNGLSHTYKVENGKVYKGKIILENTSNQPQNVKIFLQDFSYKSDGTINYSLPHTNERSNTDWIKCNTNLVTIDSKQKTEVFYEITVPNKIADPGSYWSVIIVEPIEDIKPNNNKSSVSITSIIRYAIQVITDLDSEKAKPELKFEHIKIEKEEGKRIVKVAIANYGNLYSKPSAIIEIYHQKNGHKEGTFSSLAMGLLPNTSKMFPIDISKIPPDKYNAVIIATDENDNAFALNVELEVKND